MKPVLPSARENVEWLPGSLHRQGDRVLAPMLGHRRLWQARSGPATCSTTEGWRAGVLCFGFAV
jgi:hypothetical protein